MKLVSNKRLLCTDGKICVCYKRGSMYFEDQNNIVFKTSIPQSGIKQHLSRLRLFERMMRLEPKVAILKDGVCYFSCHGAIYRCDWSRQIVEKEHSYRKSMNNPITLFMLDNVKGFENGIIYGEYWGNVDKERVLIYQQRNNKWEVKYSYPEGTITHIHGFVKDPQHDRVLILTGDFDEGSGIWEAQEDFSIVRPLLVGKQQFRCCVAFACSQGILYATDTPLEDNAIYMYDEQKDVLNKIVDLPGPCIYGRDYIDQAGNRKFIFATSVEPDSRITGIRYLLSYKLGKGVKDRNTHIFVGDDKEGFQEITALKKDFLPMGLFQFGNVMFPDSEEIVCVPQAVKKWDGKTLSVFD